MPRRETLWKRRRCRKREPPAGPCGVRPRELKAGVSDGCPGAAGGCPQGGQVWSDGREVRPHAFRQDGRDAGAVANHGGDADATHGSAGCRGGRRLGSVAGAGSESRLLDLAVYAPANSRRECLTAAQEQPGVARRAGRFGRMAARRGPLPFGGLAVTNHDP